MSLKLIAVLVLSGLLAAACWLSYRAGQNTMELEYQKILTDLSAQSEKYRKLSEEHTNVVETKRITQKAEADKRARGHADRLRKSKPVVQNSSDSCSCLIPDDHYIVLREAAGDPRLSKTDDTARTIDTTKTAPNAGK